MEIKQIKQTVQDFLDSKLDLSDFLKYFEIDEFRNVYYESANSDGKQLFTEREGVVALLFEYYLRSLLNYDVMNKFKSIRDYVIFVNHKFSGGGTISLPSEQIPINDQKFLNMYESMNSHARAGSRNK